MAHHGSGCSTDVIVVCGGASSATNCSEAGNAQRSLPVTPAIWTVWVVPSASGVSHGRNGEVHGANAAPSRRQTNEAEDVGEMNHAVSGSTCGLMRSTSGPLIAVHGP